MFVTCGVADEAYLTSWFRKTVKSTAIKHVFVKSLKYLNGFSVLSPDLFFQISVKPQKAFFTANHALICSLIEIVS